MTLAELRRAVELLPSGAALTLPREALLEALTDAHTGTPGGIAPTETAGVSWRERLWTCPSDTRLGVREVCEALGKPKSWVYRAVAAKRGKHRLPARRLGGELVFEAGKVRAWVQREETC